MINQFNKLSYIKVLVGLIFLFCLNLSYALPLSIVPAAGTTLPSTAGDGYALAYYDVKNITTSVRKNIHVKYLPPNVSQILTGGSNLCSESFSLQPNESCILQLKITGKVYPNDPIVSNHIFICFPGETTCAGTNYPLDVDSGSPASTITSIALPPPTGGGVIQIGQTSQLNVFATYVNGQTQIINSAVIWASSNPQVATVSATGLVTAIGPGSTSITASTQGGARRRLILLTVAINNYSITASAGANGTISPNGAVSVNKGASQTFAITPNAGYRINELRVDGALVASAATYAFTNVTTNHTIAVSFTPVTYIITASSADANGTISPTGAVSVNSGASQTFMITPNTNYRINELRVDGVIVASAATYTFNNVTTDHTIAVSFTPVMYTITASSADANGTISPSGAVSVNSGASQTFMITPNANYRINELRVDGVVVASAATYTFNNVTTDHTIAVSFTPVIYTITASSADANGTISPSGAVSVNSGASQTFTITPNTNYRINELRVDGVVVASAATYTFNNVTTNHTIAVSFVLNTFTITSSSGANGSISPSGAVSVNSGASRAFTITPNSNYRINELRVDGVLVTSASTYTFNNVTTDHTITVSFILSTFNITSSSGPNGFVSPSGVITVNSGSNQQFFITPNSGYQIDQLTVDGLVVTNVTVYTFTNVTTTHSITATFQLIPIIGNGLTFLVGSSGNQDSPILAVSQDGDSNFSARSISGSPFSGYFTSATCAGDTASNIKCAAAGAGSGPSSFIAYSADAGGSWTTSSIFGGAGSGVFYDIGCADSQTGICIAAGYNFSSGLIARSDDGAVNFSNITTPSNSIYYGASCAQTGFNPLCAAVGESQSTQKPLVTAFINGSSSPTNFSPTITGLGYLLKVSCSVGPAASICVGVGTFSDTGKPLVISTIDGGSSWFRRTILPLAATGYFNSVSCFGNAGSTARCIAVGLRADTGGLPMIYRTSGGSSFTAVNLGSPPSGELKSVSCAGSNTTAICAAVGINNNNSQPLLYVSSDSGTNWSLVNISGIPNGTFVNANCGVNIISGNLRCIASGQTSSGAPLVAKTTFNSINTWEQVFVSGAPGVGSYVAGFTYTN
jgi:hypothetical protein